MSRDISVMGTPLKRVFVLILVAAALVPGLAPAADDAGFAAFRARNYCRLLAYLQAVYHYPKYSDDRFVIAVLPARPFTYVQCALDSDLAHILCEVASGKFMIPALTLVPPSRLPVLAKLGFSTDPGDGNYALRHPFAGARELPAYAELFLRAFYFVYRVAPDTELRLDAPLVRAPPPAPDDDYCLPLTS